MASVNNGLHAAKAAFISPEVLAGAIAFTMAIYFPDVTGKLGTAMAVRKELWFLFGVPGGAFALCLGTSWKVLFPRDGWTELHQWPDYPKLRISVLIGLAYGTLGAACALVALLIAEDGLAFIVGAVYAVAVTVQSVAAATLLVAAFTIKSISHGER